MSLDAEPELSVASQELERIGSMEVHQPAEHCMGMQLCPQVEARCSAQRVGMIQVPGAHRGCLRLTEAYQMFEVVVRKVGKSHDEVHQP